MNAVDGSSHVPQDKFASELEEELPSLLVVILDTSPLGWGAQSPPISLRDAVASLLIFINSHLALSHSNEVAVIAAHTNCVRFLYPVPGEDYKKLAPKSTVTSGAESSDDVVANGQSNGHNGGLSDSSIYRQFRVVDESVLKQLEMLLLATSASDIEHNGRISDATLISGALSTSLAYINRLIGGVNDDGQKMRARILVVSVCSDLASQYVPIMNCIFAAQKMKVPIDICKIGNETVFLQQAADTTGGVYLHLEHPAGMIQYLMTAFLPDRVLRKHLVLPTLSSIDFRAACFCHKRIVDIGYVCNICLSIFCQPPADGSCAICDTIFDPKELANLLKKPIVVATGVPKNKAKKKKKKGTDSTPTLTPGGP
ncbi:TFIIH subunit Tfb4/p34 [Lipomyces tetrasporus]|uniref:General transcription and DNA repair factor IIH subunit TFB4 n=1 Tax=Lipomyces tetrasporus TaxID=54092 RepID=A0AAD7QKD7_9ASCO|nr:TFIIH subunit Tfb4/p34 [Lipomyces tetrasporus]KAJ8096868.1 TFIIH subunit Tfb4/p34 [Lipomyces tetrasporus]